MIRYLMIALLFVTGPSYAQDNDREAVPGNPEALDDPAEEARARALMTEIRCLVCQNQSIEDSDAELATDLRMIVREKIAEGLSDQQIKDWLVARYGDWVLLNPPLDMRTWFLWGSPFILLVGAGIWLYRRPRDVQATKPLDAAEQAALHDIMTRDDGSDFGRNNDKEGKG